MKKIILISIILLSYTVTWAKPCINEYGTNMGDPEKDKIKCNNGNGQSCRNLADLYLFGQCGKATNMKLHTKLVKKACLLGEPTSCVLFAENYYGKDELKVAEYLEKGCRSGSNFEVCDASVENYLKLGQYTKGIKLVDYTCNKGYSSACVYLGFVYSGFWGYNKSNLKARDAFTYACKLGNEIACQQLKSNFR